MDIRLNNVGLGGERRFIGIVARQNTLVGLFEILRILQIVNGRNENIYWIRSSRSPVSDWVRPRAVLTIDPSFYENQSSQIQVIFEENLRINSSGQISRNLISYAFLERVHYTVSFWEQMDSFPVYTLFPDSRLPWSNTIRSPFYISEPLVPAALATVQYASSTPTRRTDTRRRRRLSDSAVCPITLEPLHSDEVYWTPCDHAFSVALLQALEVDERCPLCRAPCSLELILSP
jgi:hypothetical protein